MADKKSLTTKGKKKTETVKPVSFKCMGCSRRFATKGGRNQHFTKMHCYRDFIFDVAQRVSDQSK